MFSFVDFGTEQLKDCISLVNLSLAEFSKWHFFDIVTDLNKGFVLKLHIEDQFYKIRESWIQFATRYLGIEFLGLFLRSLLVIVDRVNQLVASLDGLVVVLGLVVGDRRREIPTVPLKILDSSFAESSPPVKCEIFLGIDFLEYLEDVEFIVILIHIGLIEIA